MSIPTSAVPHTTILARAGVGTFLERYFCAHSRSTLLSYTSKSLPSHWWKFRSPAFQPLHGMIGKQVCTVPFTIQGILVATESWRSRIPGLGPGATSRRGGEGLGKRRHSRQGNQAPGYAAGHMEIDAANWSNIRLPARPGGHLMPIHMTISGHAKPWACEARKHAYLPPCMRNLTAGHLSLR